MLPCQGSNPDIVGGDGCGSLFKGLTKLGVGRGGFRGDFQHGPVPGQFFQPSKAAVAFAGFQQAETIFPKDDNRKVRPWSGSDLLTNGWVAHRESGNGVRVHNHSASSDSNISNSASMRS